MYVKPVTVVHILSILGRLTSTWPPDPKISRASKLAREFSWSVFFLNHRASCSVDVGHVLQQEGNYFDDEVAVGIDSLGRCLFQFTDLQNLAAAIAYFADRNIRLHKNVKGKREGDFPKIHKLAYQNLSFPKATTTIMINIIDVDNNTGQK